MSEEKISFWYIFFSHHPYSELNRTFKLRLLNKNLYICARCTGQYVSFFLFSMIMYLGFWDYLPTIIIYLLPLPATLDWLTQAIKLRESNNTIRLFSGALFGLWLSILVYEIIHVNISMLFHLSITAGIYFVLVISVFLIKRGSLDEYLKPYEDFIDLYERQKKAAHLNEV